MASTIKEEAVGEILWGESPKVAKAREMAKVATKTRASALLQDLLTRAEGLTREVAGAEAEHASQQQKFKEIVIAHEERKRTAESYERMKREQYYLYEAAIWDLSKKQRALEAIDAEIKALNEIVSA